MELHNTKEKIFFELKPKGVKTKGIRFASGRKLLGSSETCEIYLPFAGISPIHAVVEISEKVFKIYDMNSKTGTYVNNEKIVQSEFKAGDVVKIGNYEFIFSKVSEEIKIPSVLAKNAPPIIGSDLPPTMKEAKPIPPKSPEVVATKTARVEEDYIPRVEYPLAKDPNAEFSEYIFEDVEVLYPIFKYDIRKAAVEVIILSRDRIFSVDYLPAQKGIYRLVGYKPEDNEIEFPYIGKKEKFQFLDITENDVVVYPPEGYERMILSDNNSSEVSKNIPTISLRSNDIARFRTGDIQIFVRRTDSPPFVKAAPYFRRDKEFKKIMVLTLFLMLLILVPIAVYTVNQEMEEEKNPERIATIIYKQKMNLIVTKSPAIDMTPEKPKEIQKSPEQVKVEQPKTPEPEKEQVKIEKPVEKAGIETAITTKPAQKAEPKKADVDKVRPMVTKNDSPGKTPKKAVPQRVTSQRANTNNSPTAGHVDTYKAVNFNSTISSVLAKGGSASSVQSVATSAGDEGSSSSLDGTGVESATSKLATVSTKTGSLAGTTEGKLDASKGVSGLANKKSIYTVGVPSPEVIMGSMDPDVIRKILQDHIPQFRNCYQQELDRAKAAFDGLVPLNFVIGSSGHVTRAGVTGESAMPAPVKKCVINVLRGIRFPEPMGGGQVEVSVPMNFYPRQ